MVDVTRLSPRTVEIGLLLREDTVLERADREPDWLVAAMDGGDAFHIVSSEGTRLFPIGQFKRPGYTLVDGLAPVTAVLLSVVTPYMAARWLNAKVDPGGRTAWEQLQAGEVAAVLMDANATASRMGART